ncbi:Lrp/AsnC family transcriptional regulator [Aeromicrobium sp.]
MVGPQNVPLVDEVDRRILAILQEDGRIPNNALAETIGISASTCLARVRNLRSRGAIRGIHADLDPRWLGQPIQAMISVQLRSDSRAAIPNFSEDIARHRSVLNVYFVSGSYDFLLHVAATDTDDLRSFVVEELSAMPEVAGTETHLIFDHKRGQPTEGPQ